MAPLVRHMGIGLLELSVHSALRAYCPSLVEELSTRATDRGGNEDHLALPEVFIRPFREETDSRLEYKTPYEVLCTTNENVVLMSFQIFSIYTRKRIRSDISGRKVSEVIRKIPIIGAKVLNLRDCNFFWFADIFCGDATLSWPQCGHGSKCNHRLFGSLKPVVSLQQHSIYTYAQGGHSTHANESQDIQSLVVMVQVR